MAWQDQGRQDHGWFGNGTGSGKPPDAADDQGFKSRARLAIGGVVGALPAKMRSHAVTRTGGKEAAALVDAMAAWNRADGLDQAHFAAVFFGRAADDPAVAALRQATRETARATDPAALRPAAEALAKAMQAVGLDHWRRFLADAGQRADAADIQSRPLVPEAFNTKENVSALTRILTSEAGGAKSKAMQAVAWTVINRMRHNGMKSVSDVQSAYAHGIREDSVARQVAQDVLAGMIPDPTHGATHMYSPISMPKEGHSVGPFDVGGGLETVPGTEKPGGPPIRNYMPSWTGPGRGFQFVPVPSVPEAIFKFYRPMTNGPVR